MRREEEFFTGLGLDPFGLGGTRRRPARPGVRPDPMWTSKQVVVETTSEREASAGAPAGDAGAADSAEIETLKARVAELETANAELTTTRDQRTESLARLQADFDNFRKRTDRERDEASVRAAERLVAELLPVLDNLERALDAAEQHEEAMLVDGVRLVQRSLADTLAREGVQEIDAEGVFDPHSQEALMAQPSDKPEGEVVVVLQKGYRIGERIVRPARVIVSSGVMPQENTGEIPEDAEAHEDENRQG